ncbi:hypothetical protein Ahy_A09g044247 [Arachis hypogaea]|uniref:Uncharacterized protein n=1 Tax=Arachis hypogaea TaxID=3818 RepID=A0A445BJR8_ARAHY|nr:hypothetical protein Ahy_A09g044247 [Arachis hypogaea]
MIQDVILFEYSDTSFPQVPQSCSKSLNWIAMQESGFLEYCGSIEFAKEMALLFPHCNTHSMLPPAFGLIRSNIHSCLVALNAHTNISERTPFYLESYNSASSTIIDSTLKEIYALSMQYLVRFDFSYYKKDSEWDTHIILIDLKACRKQFNIIERHIAKNFQKRGYVRCTTESLIIQATVKDFDLNKKLYPIDDLDPIASDKARRFCEIWGPGEYYI